MASNCTDDLPSVKDADRAQDQSERARVLIKLVRRSRGCRKFLHTQKEKECEEQEVKNRTVKIEVSGRKLVIVPTHPFHGEKYNAALVRGSVLLGAGGPGPSLLETEEGYSAANLKL